MLKIFFTLFFFLLLVYKNLVFADDKVTLLLDWFINPDHGPIIIAIEKGYFAQSNLNVEIIRYR